MPELLLEMYKEQLDWGWITLNDLKKYVVSGLLTTENYKQITSQDYIA